MSVLLDINGTEFAYPEVNDQAWGADATDWAVAVTNGMLQKQGGLFLLLGDVDFGTNFGLISKYYMSRTANAAASGVVRLANTDAVSWRNGANGADLALAVSADALTFNGAAIGNFVSVSDTATIDLTLAAGVLSADIKALSITDSLISASAAIAVSKLAALTVSRAVVTDGSGFISAATTTATEIGYVNGVTSAIQTQLNAKQATGNYITALTGDATASGPGSAALTFATVNSNVGSFGSSTSIPTVTVNAKGLVTAASGNVVIAPAGTLTGTTLNSTVVTSSLTAVGTIATGVWNGTTIAIANGGTGQTTKQPAFDALSPLSTKGDIAVFSTVGTRLGVGADGKVLTADSGQTTGLSWTSPLTNPMNAVGDLIVGGSAGAATRLGIGSSAQYLSVVSGTPVWNSFVAPTIQRFTSSSGTYNLSYVFLVASANATAAATYTNNGVTYTVQSTIASGTILWCTGSGAPTATGTLTKASGTGDSTITFVAVKSPVYLIVEMSGGGGGGGGSGSAAGTNATAGGNTTFGSSLLTANGGGIGGLAASGGAGGTASVASPALAIISTSGADGMGGLNQSSATQVRGQGGMGGANYFGGSGAGGAANSAGGGAVANTGAGGGGGGGPTVTSSASGSGGGAGGYLKAQLGIPGSAPSATYSYAIGASGSAGGAGTSGSAGGAGAAGIIVVTEHYQG